MTQSRNLEFMVGIFVAAGIVALFFLALQVSNLGTVSAGEGYNVEARFDNIGGIKVKAPVTMAGVKVGQVTSIIFDKETFEAVVTLNIDDHYDQIPDDTFAKIFTAGLLGEQYIGLDAGGSDVYLEEGGRLQLTQSALVLEEVIGQFLFSKAQEGAE
jgi:phospholipid/cholesterol/gamma-HCH transport system substrate-binding protein